MVTISRNNRRQLWMLGLLFGVAFGVFAPGQVHAENSLIKHELTLNDEFVESHQNSDGLFILLVNALLHTNLEYSFGPRRIGDLGWHMSRGFQWRIESSAESGLNGGLYLLVLRNTSGKLFNENYTYFNEQDLLLYSPSHSFDSWGFGAGFYPKMNRGANFNSSFQFYVGGTSVETQLGDEDDVYSNGFMFGGLGFGFNRRIAPQLYTFSRCDLRVPIDAPTRYDNPNYQGKSYVRTDLSIQFGVQLFLMNRDNALYE
ncbi:MAG: hypothetical protein O2818_00685 [Bacteroidetes bacterium]|nr:hypothetical protein [Bacteroidota bacterium]MDA1335378.1 hypothetical protein [Bacteroidota bacterium]